MLKKLVNKFDFLGLKTLTVIDETIQCLRKNIYLDIDNILLNDKKTFDILKSGNTTGIFQLEGQGMRAYSEEYYTRDRFEDLIAVRFSI